MTRETILHLLAYERGLVEDDPMLCEMYETVTDLVKVCEPVVPVTGDLPGAHGIPMCPECGKFLTRDMVFCYGCGHPIDWDGGENEE